MEENKKQTAANSAKSSKSVKKEAKKDNKKDNKKASSFMAEHRAEFRKITWPKKEELIKETITVITVSIIVGIIIFAMDSVLSIGYNAFSGIGKGSENSIVTGTPSDSEAATIDPSQLGIDTDAPVDMEVVTSAPDEETPDENADAAQDDSEAEEGDADTADSDDDASAQ